MAVRPFRQPNVIAAARDNMIARQLETISVLEGYLLDALEGYLLDALKALEWSDYQRREDERVRIIKAVGWEAPTPKK